MIEKVISKGKLGGKKIRESDLRHWADTSAEERLEAVELLRKQYHGGTERLQRVVKTFKRS